MKTVDCEVCGLSGVTETIDVAPNVLLLLNVIFQNCEHQKKKKKRNKLHFNLYFNTAEISGTDILGG